MDQALSTHLFINHRLTTALLDKIRRSGITAIEIFCARQHLDYRNRAQINELRHWFADSDLKLHSLHSPMYSDDVSGRSGPQAVITITETVKAKRTVMVGEIKRAIEIAEAIPFTYSIQHFGVGGEEYDERKIDAAFTALEEISVFARQRGVEVLLENIPNAFSSSDRLCEFLAQTHLDLGFCLDTGHANLNEGVEAAFLLMRNRIRSTHIHDNDGANDSHWFPVVSPGGTIDWASTMDLFRSRPGQFPLLLEIREDAQFPQPLNVVPQIFEQLESQKPNERE